MVGIHHGQIPHVLVGTSFESLDSTLERLASFLYTRFAVRLHQRRQALVIVAHCVLRRFQGLQVLGMDFRLPFRAVSELYLARGDLQDWCLFYW